MEKFFQHTAKFWRQFCRSCFSKQGWYSDHSGQHHCHHLHCLFSESLKHSQHSLVGLLFFFLCYSVRVDSKRKDRSGNILSFLLPLFQEGQLSVTGESMCTKYWLTA